MRKLSGAPPALWWLRITHTDVGRLVLVVPCFETQARKRSWSCVAALTYTCVPLFAFVGMSICHAPVLRLDLTASPGLAGLLMELAQVHWPPRRSHGEVSDRGWLDGDDLSRSRPHGEASGCLGFWLALLGAINVSHIFPTEDEEGRSQRQRDLTPTHSPAVCPSASPEAGNGRLVDMTQRVWTIDSTRLDNRP